MIAHPRTGLAVLAFAALMLPGGATAGSTATRCDSHGCVHIHCNANGDHCYRYDDYDPRAGRRDCAGCGEGDQALGHRFRAGENSHRVCDSDGDRCYASRATHWNYRVFYRRHGYRWDN
jgi:hypothetical protein